MPKPKKPTKLLEKEQGKIYSSRYGDREHEPEPDGEPVMPDWLVGAAREHWEDVVPQLVLLGVATSLDTSSLAMMCESWQEWRDGSVTASQRNKAADRWIKLAAKFGLTPSDRAGMIGHPKTSSDDPVLGLLA